jgi:hypothetical protein
MNSTRFSMHQFRATRDTSWEILAQRGQSIQPLAQAADIAGTSYEIEQRGSNRRQ